MSECNKGYWVKNEKLVKCSLDYIHDIYWTCSNCGYQPYEGIDCDRKSHLSNFCPECGKKMEYYGEEKLDYTRILTNAEAEKWNKWKDLEEQCRLIELPCLPDEEIWVSNKRFGTHKTMYASRGAIVDTIEAGYAIGYTKEEAEAKLKEMEGVE